MPKKAINEVCQENEDIDSVSFTSSASNNEHKFSLNRNDLGKSITNKNSMMLMEIIDDDDDEEESDGASIDVTDDDEENNINDEDDSNDNRVFFISFCIINFVTSYL